MHLVKLWARALLFAAVALFALPGMARDVPPAIAEIGVEELPAEARQTLAQIKRGGPYAYRKDGAVFGNREKRLPAQSRGYYTEYTVKTPHSRDRGARRIVAGRGAERDPATSGEYYYTDDHYNSFRRIRE
jgi:ribonuclease T1